MSVEVRGTAALGELIDALLDSPREELLIGLTRSSLQPGWLAIVTEARLATDDEVKRNESGLRWTGNLTSAMYSAARVAGSGVVLLHAHRGSGRPPVPSRPDKQTAHAILSHFGMIFPNCLHGYLVINRDHVAGWVQLGPSRRPVGRLVVSGLPRRSWTAQILRMSPPRLRDERQVGALGSRGVVLLRTATVGIVGVGGAGSQVAELLAHAGVGGLLLVDRDRLEEVNLSRTHGATSALVGMDKVAVVRRMVRRIAPTCRVRVIRDFFPCREGVDRLRDVDVVVSCVDNPFAREELNRHCLRYAIPLIDMGTTITEEPLAIDGHLTVVLPGGRCLRCAGHVSDAVLDEWRAAAAGGKYGMQEGRPQVVSFNGFLASAGVTEVLKILTGFAGAAKESTEWYYTPLAGRLTKVHMGRARCRDCRGYALKPDA
jgi:molybdopterin/thiamine biosynthesis adenylyltransferase